MTRPGCQRVRCHGCATSCSGCKRPSQPGAANAPGFRLHPLKGDHAGRNPFQWPERHAPTCLRISRGDIPGSSALLEPAQRRSGRSSGGSAPIRTECGWICVSLRHGDAPPETVPLLPTAGGAVLRRIGRKGRDQGRGQIAGIGWGACRSGRLARLERRRRPPGSPRCGNHPGHVRHAGTDQRSSPRSRCTRPGGAATGPARVGRMAARPARSHRRSVTRYKIGIDDGYHRMVLGDSRTKPDLRLHGESNNYWECSPRAGCKTGSTREH